MSNSLQPHGLQCARLPCPSLCPGVCSNSCSSSRWCNPTTSSSVIPFSSCLQSFPVSESFPLSWLFIRWPKYWSFKVLEVLEDIYLQLLCILGLIPWSLRSVLLCLLQQSILKSVLSDMDIATATSFWFLFAWNNFFHPLMFSLYVPLDLKWVFCRQHIWWSCFCIYSAFGVLWLQHLICLRLK